ncbi:MAG TPA: hypothetical protein VGJ04_08470 [Pirellulales bacterium]|jgi:hypothetical protein
MFIRLRLRSAACLIALLFAATMTGCGKSYKIAEVDGQLLIAGKPGTKMHIQFVPFSPEGTKFPYSNADTDDLGKFSLEMREGNSTVNGAVVGTNRIVLTDMQYAEAGAGKGVPFRLKPEYTAAGSTPLRQEVAEGKQTIEIKIP